MGEIYRDVLRMAKRGENNHIIGGSGNDYLFGSDRGDILEGGDGNDFLALDTL